MKDGIVLFAHGSRDPEWARPFEAISSAVAGKAPQAVVRLAYLEFMRPTLAEAVATLVLEGITSIRVVPVFLGPGGHVRQELPALVSGLAAAHRGVELVLDQPIGEQPAVIDAIAQAIAAQ